MKLYKLLKDLPTFKAGDLFALKDDGCLYLAVPHRGEAHWKDQVMAYHSRTLGRFPNILTDWFTELPDAPEEPQGIKSVGNIGSSVHIEFGTEEEAEKAVEKLKAWQRLKDKGFVWQDWEESAMGNGMCAIVCQIPENNWETDVVEDLDLLFSQE